MKKLSHLWCEIDVQKPYHITLVNTYLVNEIDLDLIIIANDKLIKVSNVGLEKDREEAMKLNNNPNVAFETISQMGSLNNVFFQTIQKQKIDLVVMEKKWRKSRWVGFGTVKTAGVSTFDYLRYQILLEEKDMHSSLENGLWVVDLEIQKIRFKDRIKRIEMDLKMPLDSVSQEQAIQSSNQIFLQRLFEVERSSLNKVNFEIEIKRKIKRKIILKKRSFLVPLSFWYSYEVRFFMF